VEARRASGRALRGGPAAALLERGRERVAAAVLTTSDGTHAYGKETLRGVFARLLRALA
jgi:phage terminase large subunit-like protein